VMVSTTPSFPWLREKPIVRRQARKRPIIRRRHITTPEYLVVSTFC
jgi:hypothetical protein